MKGPLIKILRLAALTLVAVIAVVAGNLLTALLFPWLFP